MRGCSKRYRRCDMARGSLRPQKSHPSSHHELHGSLFRLLPSSRLNRCDSGYVAAAHLHKRTRDLHPSKVFSRPSVECSLAGAHSSSSQCEPAQAWEVDMCASKHHFAVGTCMPRLASKFRCGAQCMLELAWGGGGGAGWRKAWALTGAHGQSVEIGRAPGKTGEVLGELARGPRKTYLAG